MAGADAIKFGASGGAAVSKLSLSTFIKVITNKKGFGFFVIALNFLKGVLSKVDEAWVAKSPWPIVQEAGLRILANDRIMVDSVNTLKGFEGQTISKLTLTSVYSDLFSAFFAFIVIFSLVLWFNRLLFVGTDTPFLNAVLLTFVILFLVESVTLLLMIVYGDMPKENFVVPFSGVYALLTNYKIALPF